MVYLGLEVCHYKQLLVLSPPLIRSLENTIETVIRQNDLSLVKKKSGQYFIALGEEAGADPKAMLDAAFQLLAVLFGRREDLYGYNLLFSVVPDKKPAAAEGIIAAGFLDLLEEESLWIPNRDAALLQDHARLEAGDEYTRVLEIRKTEPVYNVISHIPQIRKRIIERLAQVFVKRFSAKGRNPALVLVSGPADCAKRETAAEALALMLGRDRGFSLPVGGGRGACRFPLEPLLGSIRAAGAEFLKRVPTCLAACEKPVWKAHESFLTLLLAGKPLSGDRVEEDFFILYNLFLAAYLRYMREKFLPGVLVFHDPHRLTPSVAGRLRVLVADLAVRYRIALVVVSSRSQLPALFKAWDKMRVTVKPFGIEDTRRCFATLYPGVAVPRRTVDQILRLSRGRYGAILHFIYFLRLNRKIVQEGSRFVWVPRSALKSQVPASARTAAVAIIRSLKEEARTILYASYCLGALATGPELLEFFAAIGLNRARVDEQLLHLGSMRLLFGDERPRFTAGLRAVLRKMSPQKTRYLDDQLRAFLKERIDRFLPWRAARCFRLLAFLDRGDLAVDRLAPVVNFFLDARLLAQAAYFLKAEHYLAPARLSDDKRKQLAYVLYACRIRFHLLSGDVQEADRETGRSTLAVESLVPQSWFARLYLELGRYHLCREDAAKALPLLKKSVHYFQELSMTAPSSEAFLELGAGFLVRGNLKEALEYFSFAKKLIQDVADPYIHIRALWFESVGFYLLGNYSRIIANCDQAALLAAAHGFRESELLFGFLKARVMFDLGFYDRAGSLLRDCLCLSRLYGFAAARTLLFAWLTRATAYAGQSDDALALLGTLPENEETLFFRGEAYVIAGEDKKAEKVFTKALHAKPGPAFLFPEFNAWRSGFDLVEGRCLDLNTHGSPLHRLSRAWRAVLQCRSGALDEGIAELHLLTITEKFAEADPHISLFYYLYYTVLKTLEKKKTSVQEVGHALTILNKALKHLQERATMIDEPRDRINYLTQNRWNKLMFEEGKANKLL
jgi:tetratricopeptide (TPR) repeat protein